MPKQPTTFTTVPATALAAVSGGRRAATSSRSDDRIMDQLNSLESSVRDLGRQPQQSDAMSAMMPILAMSMMNQQPAAPPPPAQPQVIVCRRRRC